MKTKQRCVEAAIQLLSKAGCEVQQTRKGDDRYTLSVYLPPDSTDPHGDRLKLAIAST